MPAALLHQLASSVNIHKVTSTQKRYVLGTWPRLQRCQQGCAIDAGIIAPDEVEVATQSSQGLVAGQGHGNARDALASAGADASHCARTGLESSPWWTAQLRVSVIPVNPLPQG